MPWVYVLMPVRVRIDRRADDGVGNVEMPTHETARDMYSAGGGYRNIETATTVLLECVPHAPLIKSEASASEAQECPVWCSVDQKCERCRRSEAGGTLSEDCLSLVKDALRWTKGPITNEHFLALRKALMSAGFNVSPQPRKTPKDPTILEDAQIKLDDAVVVVTRAAQEVADSAEHHLDKSGQMYLVGVDEMKELKKAIKEWKAATADFLLAVQKVGE